MAALQSHLLQLCPVNVLRPTFPPAVTGAAREALIDIYNDALWRNPDGFRRAMQAVYSLEPAVAPTSLDFDAMAAFDAAQLSSSRLSLHSLLQLNLHGCVWRTTRGLYAALQGSFQGVDGDSRSTWTAALFSVLLSVGAIAAVPQMSQLSAAVSCFRLSSSYWLQSAYSIAILLLYNTSFVFTQFGERIVALAAAHL
ncbi:outer envelope pore protein 16, chloroplastic [Babesia caballi]|uniref:Outer envelope pore protein 16, chloroplastic n=1 Tax=Babesia caballi TaxID=5871 RepID=A0AAV4LWA7_BABCB|nr:outer envelope pore protein 16, chloroplastic [Babesia caballi]